MPNPPSTPRSNPPSDTARWQVETSVGATRALLIEGGEVIAARLRIDTELPIGIVLQGQLIKKHRGTRRGIAVAPEADNMTLLVDKLPAHVTEGSQIPLQLTRLPILEKGRFKHAQARLYNPEDHHAIEEDPFDHSDEIHRFETGQWEEVWHAASSGELEFPGGSLLISATPAMTLIDIDGDLPSRELALAAIPAIAKAINWFELAGNIGIDFPTLETKADRMAVDRELAGWLSQWPHERTGMNGFGFVQLVARMARPSLIQRFAASPASLCALDAYRVAERASGTGRALALQVHPVVESKFEPAYLEKLHQRTGRELRISTDPGLAPETPQAQIIEQ